MIVIDASALVEVLLRTEVAERIEERIFGTESNSGRDITAPHLIDIEVAQVLRRYWLAKRTQGGRLSQALDDLAAFPFRRYPHSVLLPRIWELRGRITAYDAAYVALAEALDATLMTRDKRLARTRGHAARIELL